MARAWPCPFLAKTFPTDISIVINALCWWGGSEGGTPMNSLRFSHLLTFYARLICESIDVENYSKNLDYS